MHNFKLPALLLILILLLAACGGGGDTGGEGTEPDTPAGTGGEETTAVGDAANGESLFQQATIGDGVPGCITCHSLEPDQVVVGPSMAGVAERAGERTEGLSAEEYLRTSIVNPNEYVVEGFDPGVMYQTYGEELTEDQINDLVAYLLTLNGQ